MRMNRAALSNMDPKRIYLLAASVFILYLITFAFIPVVQNTYHQTYQIESDRLEGRAIITNHVNTVTRLSVSLKTSNFDSLPGNSFVVIRYDLSYDSYQIADQDDLEVMKLKIDQADEDWEFDFEAEERGFTDWFKDLSLTLVIHIEIQDPNHGFHRFLIDLEWHQNFYSYSLTTSYLIALILLAAPAIHHRYLMSKKKQEIVSAIEEEEQSRSELSEGKHEDRKIHIE